MSFINFVEIHDTGKKTKQFYIQNKANLTDILGYISFYPRWRKYIFIPNRAITVIFDVSCLREIADFCETQTNEWRKGLKENKDENTRIG